MCSADLFLGLLSILFPPLPVWIKCGICSADSLINILLCMLGIIPGVLHAWYIIAKFPEESYDYDRVPQDSEGGRVTYVFVHPNGQQEAAPVQAERRVQSHQPKPSSRGGMNYGTAGSNNANTSSTTAGQAGSSSHGDGANRLLPPTYAEAVQGDHKVQTHD